MNPESPSPVAPERPTDDQLVDAYRQLEALLQQAQQAQAEMIAVTAVLRDRGIDPATYTVGAGDSTTTDHKEP